MSFPLVVKRLISFLVVVIAWAVSAGCAPKDPDLPRATQAFQKRYPEYIIRSSRVVSTEESKKVVALEFEAPNNAKNRGRDGEGNERFMGPCQRESQHVEALTTNPPLEATAVMGFLRVHFNPRIAGSSRRASAFCSAI